jgi:hypothetical protein
LCCPATEATRYWRSLDPANIFFRHHLKTALSIASLICVSMGWCN